MKIVVDAVQVYRHLVATAETLQPNDRTLLLAILAVQEDEGGGDELAQAMLDYYRDLDRADRTPRQLLYFHMGLLCAALGAQ